MTKTMEKPNKLSNGVFVKRVEDLEVTNEYKEAKKEIPGLKEENLTITNLMTGKSADITLKHGKMTEDELGKELMNPDTPQEYKDGKIAAYLFQRGMESAAFLAELFTSKGHNMKETRVFKSQIRFDYELLAGIISTLFKDIAEGLQRDLDNVGPVIENMAVRMKQGSELIDKSIQDVKTQREREKGFGIYIDKSGKPYSIFEEGFDKAVEKDKKDLS
jgi:hypothetical protein